MVWCGVVWRGVAGVLWCGVVWRGVAGEVRRGVVWRVVAGVVWCGGSGLVGVMVAMVISGD